MPTGDHASIVFERAHCPGIGVYGVGDSAPHSAGTVDIDTFAWWSAVDIDTFAWWSAVSFGGFACAMCSMYFLSSRVCVYVCGM